MSSWRGLVPPVNHCKASAAASFSASFLLWHGCPINCIPLNSTVVRNWLFGSWVVLYVGASCPARVTSVCSWLLELSPPGPSPLLGTVDTDLTGVGSSGRLGSCRSSWRPKTNLPSHGSSEMSKRTADSSCSLTWMSILGFRSCKTRDTSTEKHESIEWSKKELGKRTHAPIIKVELTD